jgi:hypothetical protein
MRKKGVTLTPLRYKYAQWKQAKAAFDYHVQFDSFFYRIPYGFAGKTVSIRATSRSIEVFSEGVRIPLHLNTNYANI